MNLPSLDRRQIVSAIIASILALGALKNANASPPRQDPVPPQPPVQIIEPPPPLPTPIPIPPPSRPIKLPEGTLNIALLGVDKRPSRSFNNTDVIIIASINLEVPAVTMLSIPRDTYVFVPGSGMRKVNTAFAIGGPDLFKQMIKYNFGLIIDNYALVNFTGVVHAVDVFGGIDIIATCPLSHAFPKDPYYMGDVNIVRQDYVDTFSGEVWKAGTKVPRLVIDIPKPGIYSLDGLQALAFVRARKGIPGGDVDRGRREQRVVRALLAKAREVGSLSKLTELYGKLKDDIETDMTLETILKFASAVDRLGDTIIRSRYITGYDANGAALEGAPEPGLSRQQYIEKALNVALNQRVNEGIPIAILNGTNDIGFVAAASDRLKELGFIVTDIKPAEKPYQTSIVLDHTTTQKGSALPLLRRTFDINNRDIISQPSPDGPRYTVIVGADFNTCYYSKTLVGSGSEEIEATEDPQANLDQLPPTIVITSTDPVTLPVIVPDVVVTATELLTQTPSSPIAPSLTDVATMTVPVGDVVNVRSGPGIRFRTIGRMNGRQNARILGRSIDGTWVNVRFPKSNRLGWVKAEVVKIVTSSGQPIVALPTSPPSPTAEPIVQPTPVARAARVVVPSGDVVNLRSGPGTNFRVIGRMFGRQSATIVGKTNDGRWWQIQFGGAAAWVAAEIVRASGNTINVPVTR
jgi:anionic cell wall polymer biosynthesis LytR-Cps2A-Psr (LCP) family protein/uncharacterized protein YraI